MADIAKQQRMDETASILKACIVAHKGGIPAEKLDDEFFKFTGSFIPYLRLGFTSLYEYLGTLKDIVKVRNDVQELVYKVSAPKTAHIVDMVEKQKDPFSGTRWTRTSVRANGKAAPHESGNSKRKAVTDGRHSRRAQKRRRNDAKSRLRDWNQVYDRVSSEGEENRGDSPWDISDYEHWYEEEYSHPVNIIDKPQKMDVVCEPIVGDKLLIGDDFFLQLAIRNLGKTIWRKGKCTALHSGLCVSGQTIKDCTRSLSKVHVLANKVVIMLGAEDIYRSHTIDNMIEDMEDLLDVLESRFALSTTAITLCTLPPLANLARNCHRQQLATLRSFNSWIREQTNIFSQSRDWHSGLRYNFIEFFSNYTNAQTTTAYDYFQMDARMVSGSSHPYVLWNLRGRRLAMTLLRGGRLV